VLDSTSRQAVARGPKDAVSLCPTEVKSAGGLGSIAEQTVDHKVDVVVLGGGRTASLRRSAAAPTTA
jgi:diacylglycerol kinase family enzyme